MACWFAAITGPALAAPPAKAAGGKVRLVVMADDMGVAHGINAGTIEAFKNGIVTTTNVIVPAPWFLESARFARENPNLDFGIHLALTSEWRLFKWRPLTHGESLTDADGFLLPLVWPQKDRAPRHAILEMKSDICEIERELRAQILLARRHIPRVSYLWGHMGVLGASPEIKQVGETLAKEFDIPIWDTVLADLGIKRVDAKFERTDGTAERARKLAERLATLEPGDWFFIEHASINSEEVAAMDDAGQHNVAEARAAVLALWTDPAVKDAVRKRGIEMTSAAAFAAEWKATRGKRAKAAMGQPPVKTAAATR